MDKETLRAVLKETPTTFTAEEIEMMMDEELEKPVGEMDTDLIDLCLDFLIQSKKCS